MPPPDELSYVPARPRIRRPPCGAGLADRPDPGAQAHPPNDPLCLALPRPRTRGLHPPGHTPPPPPLPAGSGGVVAARRDCPPPHRVEGPTRGYERGELPGRRPRERPTRSIPHLVRAGPHLVHPGAVRALQRAGKTGTGHPCGAWVTLAGGHRLELPRSALPALYRGLLGFALRQSSCHGDRDVPRAGRGGAHGESGGARGSRGASGRVSRNRNEKRDR